MNAPTYHPPRMVLILGIVIVFLLLLNVGVTVYFSQNPSKQRYSSPTGPVQNMIESITFQFNSKNDERKVPLKLLDTQQEGDFFKANYYVVSSFGSASASLAQLHAVLDPVKQFEMRLQSNNETRISVCEQGQQKCRIMSRHKLSGKLVAAQAQLIAQQLKIRVEETFGSLKEGIYESDPLLLRFD